MSNEVVLLKKGDKGGAVAAVEDEMKRLGFYAGGEDSVFGGGLETAVKKFQEAVGLEQTGQVDNKNYNVMMAIGAHFNHVESGETEKDIETRQLIRKLLGHEPDFSRFKDLHFDENGKPVPPDPGMDVFVQRGRNNLPDSVEYVKGKLKHLGYYSGKDDAAFGADLEAAVKDFQKDTGLKQTGIVDRKKTFALMEAITGHFEALQSKDTDEDKRMLQQIKEALGHDLDLSRFKYSPDAKGKPIAGLGALHEAKALFASVGAGDMQPAEGTNAQLLPGAAASGRKLSA